MFVCPYSTFTPKVRSNFLQQFGYFEDILFVPYITILGVENVDCSSEMASETTPPLKVLVTEVLH